MRMTTRLACLLAVGAAVGVASSVLGAEPLPAMRLDPAATTVSGLSSGAYMAVQFHVAHSAAIRGAGLVAGGPYFCAEGQLATALNRCMKTLMGAPDSAALLARARSLAGEGKIDPPTGLAGARVYLFSGARDDTITRPVMDAARDFYRRAGAADASIKYVTDIPAGHGFIVEQASNACAATASPFINDCDYDQAGDILRHLYGPLQPPGSASAARLMSFDQAEFLAAPESHGMAPRGFAYVPVACAAASDPPCRLHIAFAGCNQTPAEIGDLFARSAGFNRWAETNRLVILYPQSSASSGNPNGCWDWWGYDDPAYHTKHGRQVAAVARMAARLGVPLASGDGPAPGVCKRYVDWNWRHWVAGRAEACGWFQLCATGSGEPLGPGYLAATLYENPEGTFSTQACAP
ncbi:MAG: hypothetical protein L6R19_17110 [Alphaproteobacteria bacterium]|nr:hypothetical protein [Alphaproteobacteria bacterium]